MRVVDRPLPIIPNYPREFAGRSHHFRALAMLEKAELRPQIEAAVSKTSTIDTGAFERLLRARLP